MRDFDLTRSEVDLMTEYGQRLPNPSAGREHEGGQVRQVGCHRTRIGSELVEPCLPFVVGECPCLALGRGLDRVHISDRVVVDRAVPSGEPEGS
ncbi:hypothetical protein [Kribbella sp. NBC_00889]|uniref:hypothetical protein n=1 Tax=Kribbella sp. NBC_00889 TaxID=2975974 RepID=UPI003863442D|nr:hypothetical protein OG817_24975 [Kribbella sp. NBC_00889]